MRHRIVYCILAVLLMSSMSPFASTPTPIYDDTEEDSSGIERIVLTPDPDSIRSVSPSSSWDGEEKIRETTADTHIGQYTISGLQSDVTVPEVLTTIRTDLSLIHI